MLGKLSSKGLQERVDSIQGSILYKIYENRDGLTSDELIISKYAKNAFEGKHFLKYLAHACPIMRARISVPAWLLHDKNEVSQHVFEYHAIEAWNNQTGTCPITRRPIKKLFTEEEYKKFKLLQDFREYYSTLSDDEKKEVDRAISNIIVAIDKELLNNILLSSTKEGNLGHIKEAIRLGANINTQNNYDGTNHGDTPLFIAAQLGHKEIVEYLIANGADLNIKNNLGRTPLLAVTYKYEYSNKEEVYLNIFKQLLNAKGIDLNIGKGSPDHERVIVRDISTEDGETSLYMAAKYGCLELVELLLKKEEINVNCSTTKTRNTPLHIAAEQEWTDVMRALVRKGADIHAKNRVGKTPLDIAHENGIAEYCSEIINIFDAIDKGNYKDVEEAINAGQIEKENDQGKTPLCVAAEKGNVKVVKLLLEEGAKVNATVVKNANWKPLDYAAYNGHHKIVEKLVEAGADIFAKDKDGFTPRDNAESGGYEEISKFLEKEEQKKLQNVAPNSTTEDIRAQPEVFTGQRGHNHFKV